MSQTSPIVKSLPKSQKAFYGVGHILNDLCANCWFSYALIYWTKIVGLSETDAGLLLLIGQVADAMCTMFIGHACDKTKFRWYGKRKLWHIIGTICVLLSFPFIFNLCVDCEGSSEMKKIIYYSGFVIVFQFGWGATQIAHLALIPEIASRTSDIIHLNSIRSAFLFICGIFVFGVTWFLLGRADGDQVDASLAPEFKYLSIIVICVGLFFTFIFHFGTKEEITYKKSEHNKTDIESKVSDTKSSKADEKKKTWKQWLKDSRFYKTGLLYMCTRLTINIYQSFFVLYLTDALHFNKEAIAYFPLILLISGTITSTIMQKLTKKIGSQLTYVLGASLVIGGSVWLFATDISSRNSVYGATVLSGCGISIILVTSLAKIADTIGKDKESGAFVYSCMSFLDKLSTGVGIFAIQALRPTVEKGLSCSECEVFSKIVQSIIPGAFALAGLLSMVFLFPSEFVCIRKSELEKREVSLSELNLLKTESEERKLPFSGGDQIRDEDINSEKLLELFYEKSNATKASSASKASNASKALDASDGKVIDLENEACSSSCKADNSISRNAEDLEDVGEKNMVSEDLYCSSNDPQDPEKNIENSESNQQNYEHLKIDMTF